MHGEHTTTQHIYLVWLLVKEFLQKIKEHTSECRLTADLFAFGMVFSHWLYMGKAPVHSVIAITSAVISQTSKYQNLKIVHFQSWLLSYAW